MDSLSGEVKKENQELQQREVNFLKKIHRYRVFYVLGDQSSGTCISLMFKKTVGARWAKKETVQLVGT